MSTTNLLMTRDDSRKVKRMNTAELSAYMQRVYIRGYQAGIASITSAKDKTKNEDKPETPAQK